jgi:hypothetical protein
MPKEKLAPPPEARGERMPANAPSFAEPVVAGASFSLNRVKKHEEQALKKDAKKTAVHEEPLKKEGVKESTPSREATFKENKKKKVATKTPQGEEDIYKVAHGETLSAIAGKKDIYGDRLKWTSLFKHNMEALSKAGVAISDKLPEMSLPDGLVLKFITARQAENNASAFLNKPFVVNAISTRNSNTIVLPAVSLIKRGYNVYITSAEVKGKNWLRLRAGFFENRAKAINASKKIMKELNIDDAWVAKIEKDEFRKVVGY